MVWIDKMTATVEELTKNVDDMSRIMHDTVKAIAMLTGEVKRMRLALIDIGAIAEDHADVDDGRPNTAMRVLTIAKEALQS